MQPLARALRQTFRPAPARRPDPQRKQREQAKRLAKLHKIDIEATDGGWLVWPPKDYPDAKDPWAGDHCAQDWAEALAMVTHYAGIERHGTAE